MYLTFKIISVLYIVFKYNKCIEYPTLHTRHDRHITLASAGTIGIQYIRMFEALYIGRGRAIGPHDASCHKSHPAITGNAYITIRVNKSSL